MQNVVSMYQKHILIKVLTYTKWVIKMKYGISIGELLFINIFACNNNTVKRCSSLQTILKRFSKTSKVFLALNLKIKCKNVIFQKRTLQYWTFYYLVKC